MNDANLLDLLTSSGITVVHVKENESVDRCEESEFLFIIISKRISMVDVQKTKHKLLCSSLDILTDMSSLLCWTFMCVYN
jgi:aspartate/tyrosine/aromatic aminotransferase